MAAIRRDSFAVRRFQQLMILARVMGYNQTKVARALGVSKATVSRWMRGKVEPSGDNYLVIARLEQQLTKTRKLTTTDTQQTK